MNQWYRCLAMLDRAVEGEPETASELLNRLRDFAARSTEATRVVMSADGIRMPEFAKVRPAVLDAIHDGIARHEVASVSLDYYRPDDERPVVTFSLYLSSSRDVKQGADALKNQRASLSWSLKSDGMRSDVDTARLLQLAWDVVAGQGLSLYVLDTRGHPPSLGYQMAFLNRPVPDPSWETQLLGAFLLQLIGPVLMARVDTDAIQERFPLSRKVRVPEPGLLVQLSGRSEEARHEDFVDFYRLVRPCFPRPSSMSARGSFLVGPKVAQLGVESYCEQRNCVFILYEPEFEHLRQVMLEYCDADDDKRWDEAHWVRRVGEALRQTRKTENELGHWRGVGPSDAELEETLRNTEIELEEWLRRRR